MNMIDKVLAAAVPGLAGYAGKVPGVYEAVRKLVDAGFGSSPGKWLGEGPWDPRVAERFVNDLGRVDFEWLARLRADVLALGRNPPPPPSLEPFPSVEAARLDHGSLEARGREDLKSGRWGVVIFAGGAATRFWAGAGEHPQAAAVMARYGGSAPKGLFPVCERSGRSFLDLFAAQMIASGRECGRFAPLVLMASSGTARALREWVDNGTPREWFSRHVLVMEQAEHPRLDMDGDLIVRPDGSLVFTGDGHGGVFGALLRPAGNGTRPVDWLRSFGVTDVVLHNVDNVAANALEPCRLGFHAAGGYGMTLSAVGRRDPFEKVGLVALNRGSRRVDVVEYSVCPRELALAVDGEGAPLFKAAHINTNLVSLDSIRADLPPTLYTGKEVDVGGRLVPACSHEMLNQSLAGMLDPVRVGCLILDRGEFFQPTKSLSGADSLVTTRAWLGARGIE